MSSSQLLSLFREIDEAQNSDELCRIINKQTGGQINPVLVFYRNGLLRSQAELRKLAKSTLSQMFKRGTNSQLYTPFFQAIVSQHPDPIDMPVQAPRDTVQRRSWLFQQGLMDPRLFFDEEGYPLGVEKSNGF